MIDSKIIELPHGKDAGKKFVLKPLPAYSEALIAEGIMAAISSGSRNYGEHHSAIAIASVVEWYVNYSSTDEDNDVSIMRFIGLMSNEDRHYVYQQLYKAIKFVNDDNIEVNFVNEHIADPRNHFFLIKESIKARINFYKGVSD